MIADSNIFQISCTTGFSWAKTHADITSGMMYITELQEIVNTITVDEVMLSKQHIITLYVLTMHIRIEKVQVHVQCNYLSVIKVGGILI